MSRTLSESQAHTIVKRGELRLLDISVRMHLVSSFELASLSRCYDILVVGFTTRTNITPESYEADAVIVRDVLATWAAVSQCPGFSFRDNFEFWAQHFLPQKEDMRHLHLVQRCSRSFPRVMFQSVNRIYDKRRWRAHQMDARLQYVESSVLHVFSTDAPFSLETQSDLDLLHTFKRPTQSPVECLLQFELSWCAKANGLAFTFLERHISEFSRTENSPSSLRLVEVHLKGPPLAGRIMEGLATKHMNRIGAFYSSIPADFRVEITFPAIETYDRSHPPTSATEAPNAAFEFFISRALGHSGTEFAGCMQVLDVLNAFPHWGYRSGLQPNFVCLCSLLPCTRTLRELRVKVRSTQELVWLAYAIFHPRSQQTRWDTLVIHDEDEGTIARSRVWRHDRWRERPEHASVSWDDIGLVASDRCIVSTLLAMDPSANDYRQHMNEATDESRVWRSATVQRRTTVRTLDRTKALVVVPPGQIVELCDGPHRTNCRHLYPCSRPRLRLDSTVGACNRRRNHWLVHIKVMYSHTSFDQCANAFCGSSDMAQMHGSINYPLPRK